MASPDPFDAPSTLDASIPAQNFEMDRTIVEFIRPGMFQKRKVSRKTLSKRATGSIAARPAKTPRWVTPKSRSKKVSTKEAKSQARESARVARRRLAKSIPASKKRIAKKQVKTSQVVKVIPESYPVPHSTPSSNFKVSTEPLPPLTNQQKRLRSKIRKVLAHYYNRPLNTRDRSPWEILHSVLSFEADSKVLINGPRGKSVTAVGWLCFNQSCKRRTLMYVNRDDQLRVRVGPALQGHEGQLLAMLAQAKVRADYPLRVDNRDFTVADLIEMEQKTCYPRTELTFKLIALSHYLDSGATWINDRGMRWDIPKLIREELRQPVRGAACGGTHRLAGLTLAYKARERRGEPVDGEYLRAKKFTNKYQRYAYRLQNSDGSFSTEWFRGQGRETSIDRRLKTTGHLLEWLLYAASEKELKHRQTTRAASYLTNLMYNNRYKNWESGPLGHAIHALLLYDRMVFAPYDPPENIAKRRQSSPTPSRRR